MRELIGKSSPFWVVELGAGNGLLSRDILGYLKALATVTVHEQLNYVAVERAAHPEKRGHVAQVMSERIPFEGMVGCILSNELLDAFPVHRFQVKGGKPYEVYVSLDGQGKFIESLGTPSSPTLGRKLEAAAHWLPEGTRGGINLAVGPWMNEVSRALKRGFVVTIDYGYEARQDSLTATPSGTLQTYFHHVSAGSPYQRIGRQDITAHVDFSAVIAEGEGHGLRPLALLSQADFLRRLGLDRFIERLRSEALPAQVREANLTGMRALMKHGGLGDFKVLIQEKATGVGDIADLLTPSGSHGQSRTAVFPLPLLDSGHTPLLEGGYPHAAWQPDSYWDEDSEIGASEDTKASEQS
jgi:SAM-dependent MidA family methyltransferase